MLLNLIWLLPLILGLAWLGHDLRRRRLARILRGHELAPALAGSADPRRRAWRLALFCLALAAGVWALGRPQWGSRLVERPRQGRDLVILLDCSRSMLARDVKPGTRLDHARWLLHQLLPRAPGDRFALVPFAGQALAQCPLTANHDGFLLFLDAVNTDTVPLGGSNLEEALRLATDVFQAAEGGHRAILLLTDGEQLSGDYRAVLRQYRDRRIPVFAVGLGDPAIGSFIQLPNGEFVTDDHGQRVRTRLDEAALREIAQASDGAYLRSTPVDDGLDFLAGKIRGLIPAEHAETGTEVRPIERYQWPLALAVLLLLARLCLGERRRPAAVLALLLTAGSFLPAQAVVLPAEPPPVLAGPAREAGLARAQELEAAAKAAQDPREQARLTYNLGLLRQQLGQDEAAAAAYEQVLSLAAAGPDLRAAAQQNYGLLRHAQALKLLRPSPEQALPKLQEAQTSYREALRLAPGREALARDLELALRHQELAEQFRRQKEELAKQQDAARQAAEAARRQQEQANNQRQEGPRRQEERQAQEQAETARKQAEKLAEQARQAGQEQQQQQAEAAARELADAREHQRQAQEQPAGAARDEAAKKAEEALARAVEKLGGKPSQKEQPQPQPGPQSPQGNPSPQPQLAQGDTPPPDAKPANPNASLDKLQALQLLHEMQQREKDWQQYLNERRQAQRRQNPVAKDW